MWWARLLNVIAAIHSVGAPPAPFTPTSIAGCQLWLDASDTATISLSGSSVTQWNDKSGNTRNFAQGTAGQRPLSGTRTQNSLNLIDFDGSDDKLVSSSAASTWSLLHDGTQYTLFFAAVKDGSGYTDIMGTNADASANIGVAISETNSGGLSHYVTRGVSGNSTVENTTSSIVSGFHYVSIQAKPSDATAANRSELKYKNGTAIKNNSLTNTPSASAPTSTLTIGDSASTTTLPFNGAVGEVIIYNSFLTGTDLSNVNSYLATKWGV